MKIRTKFFKNVLLILMFSSLYLGIYAQEASVEKSIFGVETGFLGLWVNNEVRLSNKFTLRSEIGLNAGIIGRGSNESTGLLLTPEITIEPRWYFNLNKRKENSKDISGNAGNFFSLKTSYSPDWFAISNMEDINSASHFSIIPTFGIRRNIGNHFYFETGVGVGYRHYFGENAVNLELKDKIALNLHLRFGFRF